MIELFKEVIKLSIQDTPLLYENEILTGFSGNKMIRMLQGFTQLFKGEKDICYLEVGVFEGLTLLSVSGANPQTACYGIDNYKAWVQGETNFKRFQHRKEKLQLTNAHILNEDFEDALLNLKARIGDKKIGVYFIDGPHDYRSQLTCLLFALPYLHENAVIIIDDCNYRHVRQANADFLVSHPEFKLLFDSYTSSHPDNMTENQKPEATQGWWDGVNVIVRDKDNKLPQLLPPTHRDRSFFFNDHLIHASASGAIAPILVRSFSAVMQGHFYKGFHSLGAAWKRFRKQKLGKLYFESNTYSQDLPKHRFNE
jgi:hypothetical protein